MGELTARVGKAYFADTPYLRLIKVQSGHSGQTPKRRNRQEKMLYLIFKTYSGNFPWIQFNELKFDYFYL